MALESPLRAFSFGNVNILPNHKNAVQTILDGKIDKSIYNTGFPAVKTYLSGREIISKRALFGLIRARSEYGNTSIWPDPVRAYIRLI